jgi:class 3 adenylate cyclase
MVTVDGNYSAYNYVSSAKRIDEILDQPSGQFEETKSLPDRDRLTFTNGFYGLCSAIFVDIRDSSGLTDKHTRPTLAKIYRAFISEMVAVLNGADQVREVNIVGDCVWAVYNTPNKTDIDNVFSRAAHANTLKELLNKKLEKKGFSALNFGIGIDYGRALMIKAGHSGSGINDVVYMGDVVNSAAHLAHKAGRGWNSPIWTGAVFAGNLNEHNSGLLTSSYDYELSRTVHVGNVVNVAMNDWISENVK